MELWIARDLGGGLSLHYERPSYFASRGWDKGFATLSSREFPEVTFANSPQKVKLELIEEKIMNEVKFDAKMSPYSNSELSIIVKDMTQTEHFRKVAEELSNLYEAKNKAYGNSFGDTYQKLGIISAVTRISDKYNRLCNLATNPDIDNLGESLDDTLRDLASYAIMTIIELENSKQK